MPYFQFKNQNIFYEDQGTGPCLFYIHEWNSSSLSFRKLNSKFYDDKYRVICMDLPGYGNSEFMEGMQFDDFSRIIIELIDDLKIQKCTFMGFCLGTTIILDFQSKFPERVLSLILVEPIVRFPNILIPLLIPGLGVACLNFLTTNRHFFYWVASRLTGPDRRIKSIVYRAMGNTDPHISIKYLKLLFRKHRQIDFNTLNFDLQKDCICILAQNTNSIFKKNAASILNHFKIVDSVILKNTSHFALLEQPAEVAQIIIKYLEREREQFQ